MSRYFWTLALAPFLVTGCRTTCCQKKTCANCTTVAPYLSSAPVNQPPEILMPSAPPPNVMPPSLPPTAPPPSLPPDPPRSSGYVPPVDPTARIATAPVQLETPEFSDPTRPAGSTSLKANEVSRMGSVGGIRNTSWRNPVIVAERIETGIKPGLADLERLQAAGIHRVVLLAEDDSTAVAVDRVYSLRGIRLTIINPTSENGFSKVAELGRTEKIFVAAANTDELRAWWRRYFHDVELLSDDAARVRSDRIAFGN